MLFGRRTQAILVVLCCVPALVLVGRICLSGDLPKRATLYRRSGAADPFDRRSPLSSGGTEKEEPLLVEFSLIGAVPTCRMPICMAATRLPACMRQNKYAFRSLISPSTLDPSTPGLTVPLADALDASLALLPEEVRAEQELLNASQRKRGRDSHAQGSLPVVKDAPIAPDHAAGLEALPCKLLRSAAHDLLLA